MSSPFKNSKYSGFTIIELLMAIMLLSILTMASITMISDSVDEGRFEATHQELNQIRNALIGNSDLIEQGSRTDFGFLGDIGRLPNNGEGLSALLANPNSGLIPNWSMNTNVRFGLGWNGPYMLSGPGGSLTVDGWGRSYNFNFASTPATITSCGANGVCDPSDTGLDQDITVIIPSDQTHGTVYGFISDGGSPYDGDAEVELYYPDSGNLATRTETISSGDEGAFQFTGVPFGRRSVTVFIPDKTSPTETLGPIVFTLDSTHYVIPSDSFNFNLGGGGGGSGGGSGGGNTYTGTPSCSSPAGLVSYLPGSANVPNAGGKRDLHFDLNVSSHVSLEAVGVNLANEPEEWDELRVQAQAVTCGQIGPCPVPQNAYGVLDPAVSFGPGSPIEMQIHFIHIIQNESQAEVMLFHDQGCEVLQISDL